jgi:predicted nucleic acid-binding protein
MVAAVCAWHEHHARATAAIGRRLRGRERMIVAAPALIEAYSVLTRLPAPYRLAPADALAVLQSGFVRGAQLVALPATGYRDVLGNAPGSGIAGGRIYDEIIGACCLRGRATTLLTFNLEHFESFRARGLDVVVPAG